MCVLGEAVEKVMAADTVAFVSHFPRDLWASQELYICGGTKQPVRGSRGDGAGTEVGVEGTGCHCGLCQGSRTCKCSKRSQRRRDGGLGSPLIKKTLRIYEKAHSRQISVHNEIKKNKHTPCVALHTRSTAERVRGSVHPCSSSPTCSLFILNRFVRPEPLFI